MSQVMFPTGVRFFELDGVPVCLWPDRTCKAYDEPKPRTFNAEAASRHGKAISEATFRVMLSESHYRWIG